MSDAYEMVSTLSLPGQSRSADHRQAVGATAPAATPADMAPAQGLAVDESCPLLPDKPHRPWGTPPRCKVCGGVTSVPGEYCNGCRPDPSGRPWVWPSLIDYAYGRPPVTTWAALLDRVRA